MNYWQTEVYGDTLEQIEAVAESAVTGFFGFKRDYVLDVRPNRDAPIFMDSEDVHRWQAKVRVDF